MDSFITSYSQLQSLSKLSLKKTLYNRCNALYCMYYPNTVYLFVTTKETIYLYCSIILYGINGYLSWLVVYTHEVL